MAASVRENITLGAGATIGHGLAAKATPSPQQVELLVDGFDRLNKLWLAAEVVSGYPVVQAVIDTATLAPGSYQGTVTIATNAANSALTVWP